MIPDSARLDHVLVLQLRPDWQMHGCRVDIVACAEHGHRTRELPLTQELVRSQQRHGSALLCVGNTHLKLTQAAARRGRVRDRSCVRLCRRAVAAVAHVQFPPSSWEREVTNWLRSDGASAKDHQLVIQILPDRQMRRSHPHIRAWFCRLESNTILFAPRAECGVRTDNINLRDICAVVNN